MPANLSATTAIVIALSMVLLAGFLFGSWRNRQRAREQANWIRSALRSLGLEPEFPPLGAFGFVARAERPTGPLRNLQAFVVFVPREVLPLWGIRWLSGASDTLTIHVTLAKLPSFEGDLVDTATRLGRQAIRRLPQGWQQQQIDGLLAAGPDAAATERVTVVAKTTWHDLHGARLLSLRRKAPHLLVTLQAPSSEIEACETFSRVWNLALEMAKGGPELLT